MNEHSRILALLIIISMVSTLIPVANATAAPHSTDLITKTNDTLMSYSINQSALSQIRSFSMPRQINLNLSDYNVLNYSTQLSSYLDWTSQEVYYNGTFYITGGSGLISLNGGIGNYNFVKENSPSGGYCRYIVPYNGSLMLGGNYFDPDAGLYVFLYHPKNNTLTNISGELPSSITQFGSEHNIIGMQQCGNFTYVIYNQNDDSARAYIEKFNKFNAINISSQLLLYGSPIVTASGGRYMMMIGGQSGGYSYLYNEMDRNFRILSNTNITNLHTINCPNEVSYVDGNFVFAHQSMVYMYNPNTNNTYLLNNFPNYTVTFVSSGPSNSTLIGLYMNSHTTLLIMRNGSFYDMGSYYGILNDASFSEESGGILLIGDSILSGRPVSYYLQLKSTDVYFEEKGLPSGSNWTLELSGTSFGMNLSTNNTELDVMLTYGNYTVRAKSLSRIYHSIPIPLDVDYQGIVVQINFMPYLYNVTFDERGLPLNTNWNVKIISQNGSKQAYNVNGSKEIIKLHNGTYNYSANTSLLGWFSFNSTGEFSVNGSGIFVNLSFVRSYIVDLHIVFPYVIHQWFINGTLGTEYHFNLTGDGNFTQVYLPNGTYLYHGATVEKKFYNKGGNFSVTGENISVNVSFIPYLYNITVFKNSTIDTGEWGFYVNNTTFYENNSSGQSLTFKVTNGSYYIKFFNDNNRYRPETPYTNIRVNGTPIKFYLKFLPSYYVVFTTTEVLHRKWNVYLKNSSGFVEMWNYSGRNMTFIVVNGTYYYSTEYSGYHLILSPDRGKIVVYGKNVSINLTPVVSYNVNFSEMNLLNGTRWYVNITTSLGEFNGTSNLDYINICLPDGNFIYSVESENKIFTFQTGSSSVNGFNTTLYVVFNITRYEVVFTLNNFQGSDFVMNLTETPIPEGLLHIGPMGQFDQRISAIYTMYLVNGTYKLNAHLLNRTYTLNGYAFSVKGSSAQYTLNLRPYLYSVNFILNSDGVQGSWSVNGVNATTSSAIDIYQINGTHKYTIQGPFSVFINRSYGEFILNGKNLTIEVSFIKKNQVQILETYGLNYVYQALNTIQNSYLNIFVLASVALIAFSSYRAYASIRRLKKKS